MTQRVWDYAGDTYVHRLNLSKTDGKLVKEKHICGFPDGNSEDSAGIDGTLFASQVEAVIFHTSSQLLLRCCILLDLIY